MISIHMYIHIRPYAIIEWFGDVRRCEEFVYCFGWRVIDRWGTSWRRALAQRHLVWKINTANVCAAIPQVSTPTENPLKAKSFSICELDIYIYIGPRTCLFCLMVNPGLFFRFERRLIPSNSVYNANYLKSKPCSLAFIVSFKHVQ